MKLHQIWAVLYVPKNMKLSVSEHRVMESYRTIITPDTYTNENI
jgi:hypothetical protein